MPATKNRSGLFLVPLLIASVFYVGCRGDGTQNGGGNKPSSTSTYESSMQGLYRDLLGPEFEKALGDYLASRKITRKVRGTSILFNKDGFCVFSLDFSEDDTKNVPFIHFVAQQFTTESRTVYWRIQELDEEYKEIWAILEGHGATGRAKTE